MEKLIEQMIAEGYLKTPNVIDAFKTIRRRDFLPSELVGDESINAPLPIGYGQTISQPLTVAFMLELLEPEAGQKILDIGSGSGWTSGLLSHIAGDSGHVYAIERVAELKNFGQKNIVNLKLFNVTMYCQDGAKGLPEAAPFDRILVSAAAAKIPKKLKDQLKIGGRMVIPTEDQAIVLVERTGKSSYRQTSFPGFVFVPLVSD